MNVFVLSTGRAGTMTFARACSHLTNYTAAHESRWGRLGPARFDYPARHIEADNRLSWYLGRLHHHYGDDAFYVHMVRDRDAVARSFMNRRRKRISILRAYAYGVLGREKADHHAALDMWDTVTSNIRYFLRDRVHSMEIRLAEAQERFPEFLERIGAEGDLDAAVAEWSKPSNRSSAPPLYRRVIDRIAYGP